MKKKPLVRPPSASSASSAGADLPPSHEEIARRAEALWREKGCPQGRDDEIWLEAEQQLLRLPALARGERDRVSLADPRFAFNRNGRNLTGELDERFPGATGKETTSL